MNEYLKKSKNKYDQINKQEILFIIFNKIKNTNIKNRKQTNLNLI